MSKAKHTQGKWQVEKEPDGKLWVAIKDGNFLICEICQEEDKNGNILSDDLSKADANLIASAPEFLALMAECDDYLKGNKLNNIGNGSILHTKMKKLIKRNS